MNPILRRILPGLILFFYFNFVAVGVILPKANPSRMVRVAVAREAREITLEVEGQYAFLDGKTKVVISKGSRLPKFTVRLLDKGILIGGKVYSHKRLLIRPLKHATVTINNHRFRGEVLLIRTEEDRLTVVNTINIEDYIKGVLYHEVSHHWPMEALKAQAVAARTYALFSMNGAVTKDFDVTNDIYSQVYGGRNSERYRTGLAVDRTVGEVLAFKAKILPAYFHATCAGMTEDAQKLWDLDLAPLKGVPCLFCQDSPHMRWKRNFQLREIQADLNRRGHKIGLIKDILIEDRDRSDRIDFLRIIDREGGALRISGKEFRAIVGPNELRSNNYEIQMQGYYVDIVGKGWGHGVGLCQWGARGMAAQQFNYKQILNYYYPGADIVDYGSFRKSANLGQCCELCWRNG